MPTSTKKTAKRGPDQALSFRIGDESIEKLEELRRSLEARTPGLRMSTSDVVRVALEAGIASLSKPQN